MRLEQLEQLLLIAKCQSMSKAAKKAFINQSGLSRSIEALENEWGCKLFVRSNKGVTATALGRETIDFAEHFVDQWYELKRKALAEDSRKNFAVLASPAVCNVGKEEKGFSN